MKMREALYTAVLHGVCNVLISFVILRTLASGTEEKNLETMPFLPVYFYQNILLRSARPANQWIISITENEGDIQAGVGERPALDTILSFNCAAA